MGNQFEGFNPAEDAYCEEKPQHAAHEGEEDDLEHDDPRDEAPIFEQDLGVMELGGLILDDVRADSLVELFDRADAVFGEKPDEDGKADHHR